MRHQCSGWSWEPCTQSITDTEGKKVVGIGKLIDWVSGKGKERQSAGLHFFLWRCILLKWNQKGVLGLGKRLTF